MSTAIARNFQIGIDPTPTNNFTLYQPATPDGTLRLGNGNTGTTSSLLTLTSAGDLGIGQAPTAYGATVRTVEAYIAGASGYTLVSASTASVKTEIASSESSLLGQVGTRSNHPLVLKTNDSERMRITSGGQVLVGVTSGDAYNPLQVQTMLGFATTGGFYSEINNNLYYGSAAWRNRNAGPVSQIVLDGGASNPASIRFNVSADATSTPANSAVGLSEAMRITNAGNVGIGTSSPNPISWGRSLTLNTTSNGAYDLAVNGSEMGYFYANASLVGVGSYANVPLAFYTNNTERARIDSSGQFLFRCTGLTNDAPNVSGGVLQQANGNSKIRVQSDGQAAFQFYSVSGGTSAPVGSIAVNAASVAYNTSSDYRLKENIQPMTGALAKVAALKPCTYTWKINGSDGEGFIAHELAEVVPQCVTGEKDAVETYTDEEGNEQTRPVYQGIDTSFLVATLTAAIQELKAELDAVKTELAALKGTA